MAVKVKRTRNWTFVMYPDSMPEDWQDIITSWHVPCAVSPLHDKDVTAIGEMKKEHYHVVLCFDGVKTYEQFSEFVVEMNAPIPPVRKAIVNDISGMIRYLTHEDNPEKYLYDKKDILEFAGIDVAAYMTPTKMQRYAYINEMCEWVKESGCVEFRQLVDHARYKHFSTWYSLLCDNCSNFMKNYITSCRNEKLLAGSKWNDDRELPEIKEEVPEHEKDIDSELPF